MTRMIFVNLPVADLDRARCFYEAMGFVNEPRFTDHTAAAMQWSEAINVMLLTHDKWKTFTDRPICDSAASEVALALSCDSRGAVNAMVEAGAANGGMADVNPVQDHGFMLSRTIVDPDGHVWEPMWMDPAVAFGNEAVAGNEDALQAR